MNYSLNENHAAAGVDNWYFDGEAPIVPGHLAARKADRQVLLGCSIVGMIGIGILLVIVAGSTPDITAPLLSG